MAEVYFSGFDVVTRDSDGALTRVTNTDIFIKDESATLLETLTTDEFGYLTPVPVSTTLGEVLTFEADGYAGTFTQIAAETPEEAYINNKILTFVAADDYTGETQSEIVDIYMQDLSDEAAKPLYIGSTAPGNSLYYPFESAYGKDLRFFAISRDAQGRQSATDFETAETVDYALPSNRENIAIGDDITGANNNRILITDGSGNLGQSPSFSSGQSVRWNGTAFEAYTPSTGVTIGTTSISSGTNNRVLFQSSGVVSQGNLEFSGSELKILNSTKHLEVSLDSSYNAIFGHAFAASDNVLQFQFKYYSAGGYSTRGLALKDVGNGYTTILNQTSSGALYITDGAGTPGSLVLGTRTNPADGSVFTAQSSFWWINSGVFSVGTSSLQGNAQIESFSTSKPQFAGYYDASNYFKITAASNGATTFDTVGSGAKFVFSDDVEMADGKNFVLNTTTGTKFGTSTSQKWAFSGKTPSATSTGWLVEDFAPRKTFSVVDDSDADFKDLVCTVIQELMDKGIIST